MTLNDGLLVRVCCAFRKMSKMWSDAIPAKSRNEAKNEGDKTYDSSLGKDAAFTRICQTGFHDEGEREITTQLIYPITCILGTRLFFYLALISIIRLCSDWTRYSVSTAIRVGEERTTVSLLFSLHPNAYLGIEKETDQPSAATSCMSLPLCIWR